MTYAPTHVIADAITRANYRPQPNLDPRACVVIALTRLGAEHVGGSFTARDITQRAVSLISPKPARVGMYGRIMQALRTMATEPDGPVAKVTTAPPTYRLAP